MGDNVKCCLVFYYFKILVKIVIINIIAVSNTAISEINHNIMFNFFFCDTKFVIVKQMLAVLILLDGFNIEWWIWIKNDDAKLTYAN